MNQMQFTTYNRNGTNHAYSPNINPTQNMQIMNNIQYKNSTNNIQSNNIQKNKDINITNNNETKPKEKKMKWGEPTWYLFHTLSYKIKEEHFKKVRVELLNNIYSICANLPCPMCAEHASSYLKTINFYNIQTKQDLIMMLFNFHNVVNKKKNLPLFQFENFEEKYSKAVTKNIIYNFLYHYKDTHKSIHMISNDMFRARQVLVLQEWFNNNFIYFDK